MEPVSQAVSSRVATLTNRQRECLRLVRGGYETKEIARLLSISPDRASKDIKAAMGKLDVSRRIDAARLLEQVEGAHDGPGPVRALFGHDETAPPHLLPIAGRQRDDGAGGQTAYTVEPLSEFSMPFRKRGSEHNNLGLWQRVMWIALITAFILSAFGALASGLAWLSTSSGLMKH